MAIWKRKTHGSTSSTPSDEIEAEIAADLKEAADISASHPSVPERIHDESTSLHRGLRARHITMIAIGGAIGTGLIVGTGVALAKSG